MATKPKKPATKVAVKKAAKPKAPTAAQKLDATGIVAICERTSDCVPQRTIAAEIGVSWATLMLWISADPQRSEQYARAREAQADKMAEDILQIADDGRNDTYMGEDGVKRTDQDVIARSRLRVDARKWLASKMAPKKYGDKQTIDLTAEVITMTADQRAARLAELAAKLAQK